MKYNAIPGITGNKRGAREQAVGGHYAKAKVRNRT